MLQFLYMTDMAHHDSTFTSDKANENAYVGQRLGQPLTITQVLGNFLNMSPNRSIGVASRPATVSNGFRLSQGGAPEQSPESRLTGLSGALGCERDGTKALVRWKLFAVDSESLLERALSSDGRSSCSSSFMCCFGSFMRAFKVVSKSTA